MTVYDYESVPLSAWTYSSGTYTWERTDAGENVPPPSTPVYYYIGGWQTGVWATPQRVTVPESSAWNVGVGGPVPSPFLVLR